MIAAILLIPAEGDPLGLLKEGPCGARPPMTYDHMHKHGALCWNPTCGRARHLMREGRRALVLAWDGEPVAEGLDRARRVARSLRQSGALHLKPWVWANIDDIDIHIRSIPEVFGLLAAYLGTLVLLDSEGREVTL